MVKPNDYVLLVTDTGTYNGLNHWDMVNIFKSYGCTYAYNLDGGGSTAISVWVPGQEGPSIVNIPSDGKPRACATTCSWSPGMRVTAIRTGWC